MCHIHDFGRLYKKHSLKYNFDFLYIKKSVTFTKKRANCTTNSEHCIKNMLIIQKTFKDYMMFFNSKIYRKKCQN